MDEAVPPSSGVVLMDENTAPLEPLRKGLDEAAIEGFSRINKIKEIIIYFVSLSVNYKNPSPAISNDSQNSINCRRRTTIIY